MTPKAPPLPARQLPLPEKSPADRKTGLSRGPQRPISCRGSRARPVAFPQFREMAALGAWRLLRPGRRWFSETVPGAPSPPGSPPYPPVVASITAKSKAAKSRRLQRFNERVHAAATVEEKLRLYGKLQRPKYTVYPQTFALNADRWYRSFTRTVLVPGMPPRGAAGKPAAAAAAGATLEAGRAPEPGAEAPVAAGAPAAAEAPGDVVAPGAAAGAVPYVDIGELRSLTCDALLQESFYQNKKRPFLYRDQDHTPGPFLTQLVSTLAASLSGRNPLLAASSLGTERGWQGRGRGSPWVKGQHKCCWCIALAQTITSNFCPFFLSAFWVLYLAAATEELGGF